MRVLIISDLPEIGGSSTICDSLCEQFGSWGWKVQVLARFPATKNVSLGMVERIAYLGAELLWWNPYDLKDIAASIKVLQGIYFSNPTYVINNGTGWSFSLIRLILPFSRFVYYYINHDVHSKAFRRLFFFSFLVDLFAVITPVSVAPLKNLIRNRCPVIWLPQFIEPLGCVPNVELRHSPSQPVAGFVGYLSESKGVSFLLNNFDEWKNSCGLRILGDGPCKVEVLNAVTRTAGRITYEGAFSPASRWQRLPEFYQNVDFLVMPSMRPGEGVPTVILEALSLGIPVLTTNEGGIDCFNTPELKPEFDFCVEAVSLGSFFKRMNVFASNTPFTSGHSMSVVSYFQLHFGCTVLTSRWKSILPEDKNLIVV